MILVPEEEEQTEKEQKQSGKQNRDFQELRSRIPCM